MQSQKCENEIKGIKKAKNWIRNTIANKVAKSSIRWSKKWIENLILQA